MDLVTIVIPIYKQDINSQEITSLHRCCKVLKYYPIVLVCPKNMDTEAYDTIFAVYNKTVKKIRFKTDYFKGIVAYNRLLLSKDFYQQFSNTQYILIYQLDAYVFRDELKQWCKKGFDYVGAPLVGLYKEKIYHSKMEMRVGNGGFSLRKVNTFKLFFESKKNVFNARQIIKRKSIWKKPYTRIFVLILMLLGWKNKPKTVAKEWKYNEDDFWSGLLDNSNYKLHKPTPHVALEFAFERFPSDMYKKTQKIPFGCHAWDKYEYENFWRRYIE